jgi:hypothetical protein
MKHYSPENEICKPVSPLVLQVAGIASSVAYLAGYNNLPRISRFVLSAERKFVKGTRFAQRVAKKFQRSL